jgi:regulator of protease activity HflC (stomatin/prohibitin superfamily)
MTVIAGMFLGVIAWFLVSYVVGGFFTVNQNQRAVKTSFGRAQRIANLTTLDDPLAEPLRADEKTRYVYPQVRVIMPGGPYFKWPWERVTRCPLPPGRSTWHAILKIRRPMSEARSSRQ